MARAIWKGSISFGLVTIPVELHTAVRDHRPKFRMLHARDKSPVRYERVCQRDGKPVAWEDLVKGFEYEKGRFIVLTKEDLKAAALNKDKAIDIMDFVKGDEIDDRYFETPYYLTPQKGGQHAYALLREALRESDRVGIAKVIIREAQNLAALEVIDDALVLTVLRYADELVDTSPLEFPSSEKVRKAELDMAKMLVENLAADWDPAKYTDEYRENLMKLIKARIKGERPNLPAEAEEPQEGKVVDLMERLRQSLEKQGGQSARSTRAAHRGKNRKTKAKTKTKTPHAA
jgi:DNA end-binding protein Ku